MDPSMRLHLVAGKLSASAKTRRLKAAKPTAKVSLLRVSSFGTFTQGEDLARLLLTAKSFNSSESSLGCVVWNTARDEKIWEACYRAKWLIDPGKQVVVKRLATHGWWCAKNDDYFLQQEKDSEEEKALKEQKNKADENDDNTPLLWIDAYRMRATEAIQCKPISFPWTTTFNSLQDCSLLQNRIALGFKSQALMQVVANNPSMKLATTELLSHALDGSDIGVCYTRFKENSSQKRTKANVCLQRYPGMRQKQLHWGNVETTFMLYARSGQVFELHSDYVPSFNFDNGTPVDHHLNLHAPGNYCMAGTDNYDNSLSRGSHANTFKGYLADSQENEYCNCDVEGPQTLLKFMADFLAPIDKAHSSKLLAMFQPLPLFTEERTQYEYFEFLPGGPDAQSDRVPYDAGELVEALYNLLCWIAQPGTDPLGAT
jgi:hypothetical protein